MMIQGTGNSTASNSGRLRRGHRFRFCWSLSTGKQASSSVTVGGYTEIDQQYAADNIESLLGIPTILIHQNDLVDMLHGQRWRGRQLVQATNTTVFIGPLGLFSFLLHHRGRRVRQYLLRQRRQQRSHRRPR